MTLPQMICNYQNNNDLDSLRDILEYLKSNPVYVITKIKISKKRLLTLPKEEIKFLRGENEKLLLIVGEKI